MTLADYKRGKKRELEQIRSCHTPTEEQFWIQPVGVSLLLVRGNVLERLPQVIVERGDKIVKQRRGQLEAFPAHANTLLLRQRRRPVTVVYGAWLSAGWSIVTCPKSTIPSDELQVCKIAAQLKRPVVSISYNAFNEYRGMIEAYADGRLKRLTYLSCVATEPENKKYHPEIVSDPSPMGLKLALGHVGFSVENLMLRRVKMETIANVTESENVVELSHLSQLSDYFNRAIVEDLSQRKKLYDKE